MDDPELLRHRVLREPRPGAARQLADIDVTARIDGDAVRRGELAGQYPAMRLAEPRQYLALGGVNADARPDIRPVLVDLAARSALADVAQRVTPVGAIRPEAHAVRAVQVVPLRLPFAVAVEHLHPMV